MIFFSVAWGAIWEFTPLVIGSCQSAFLLFLPSTSLTARILDSFDSYKIVNDIIWIWLSSCQPNVWSTTISWCFSGLIMCECSSRSFDSWVNSLKALAYLNFTKMCHPSSWKEIFHEVYLKQMAKYTWAVRLSPAEETASPLLLR